MFGQKNVRDCCRNITSPDVWSTCCGIQHQFTGSQILGNLNWIDMGRGNLRSFFTQEMFRLKLKSSP